MLSENARLPAGWGFPLNSRKAHYFEAGSIISVCNGMMYSGKREEGNNNSVDNCAKCKRHYQKANGEAGGKG